MPDPETRPLSGVSAVVVNFDGGERILGCLRALHEQGLPFDEIVVVDNGSSDGSPAQIRAGFPGVRLVPLGVNKGLPAARNAGLRSARSDLVFLLDHDVYPAADCLRKLLAARGERAWPVLAPRILLFPEENLIQADGCDAHFLGTLALRNGQRFVGEAEPRAGVVGASLWGCVLAERACVLDAGGFDEDYFFHFEDLEMSLRLREAGIEIRCEPGATAYHDRGTGSPGLAFRGAGEYPSRRAFFIMRNRLLTILAHYRARTLVVLGPALFLYECASFIAACRRGFPGAWVRSWWWQVAHAREIHAKRRRLQRRRTVPDRLVLSGGPIPLAPGFLRSREESRAAGLLSGILNGYWALVRRWIG